IYAYSDSKTSATAGVSATIVVLGGIGQGTLSLLFDMSGAAAVTDFGFNPVAATSTQLSVIASTTLPSVLTFCHLPFFSGTVSLTCSGRVNPPPVPFTFGLPFSLTVRLTTDSETQVAIAGPVSNL